MNKEFDVGTLFSIEIHRGTELRVIVFSQFNIRLQKNASPMKRRFFSAGCHYCSLICFLPFWM